MKPLKSLPTRDRPREKLARKGAAALSDEELVAAIVGRGVKGVGVRDIAKRVVRLIRARKNALAVEELTAVPGVGLAKAAQILSAFELARRYLVAERVKIAMATDVLPLVAFIANKQQEYFLCISLNGANEVIDTRVVTIGLLNQSQIHPREVFADVLQDRAAAVIFAHNHPSGALQPSDDDLNTHRRLTEAGKLLGIKVLDHLIVSRNKYFSFQEQGLIG